MIFFLVLEYSWYKICCWFAGPMSETREVVMVNAVGPTRGRFSEYAMCGSISKAGLVLSFGRWCLKPAAGLALGCRRSKTGLG